MSSASLRRNDGSPDLAATQRPEDLPHGLLSPLSAVAAIVAREAAKFSPEIFTPSAKERLTMDLTLQYYFEEPGYEVAYRSTAQGPEVLAVGWEEIAVLRRSLSEDARSTVHFWHP